MSSTAKRTPNELQRRDAQVVGIDAAERTVELAFSSEAEVYRPGFGIEILSHGNGACDLSRLNDGGALLADHDRARQIGVVEKAWVGNDYVGRATVRFSRSAAGREALQDVIDGIRKHVSVGYQILELKDAGVRDGDDVYLVTRWQPTEISIVSIPADTSVGIGRSAVHVTHLIQDQTKSRGMPSITQENTGRQSLAIAVRALLDEVENASPFRTHTPAGFQEPTALIPTGTARSLTAVLGSEYLPGLFDADGRLRRTPQASPSSDELHIAGTVIANSRVARAGAGVVLIPEAGIAHAVGRTGAVVMERTPGFVRVVDAAPFTTVDVDSMAQVGVSQSPIASAKIDLDQMVAKAVRFEVTRRDRMSYVEKEGLIEQILSSIVLGLARAADDVLLSALTTETLSPFTLAGVATQNLSFDELRALVGRDAIGAAVGQDGVLRAAGVPAALTADMAGSIVGAWDRAAVAMRDDVTIFIERTDLQGQMAITCWSMMQACIPAPGKFFAVAP